MFRKNIESGKEESLMLLSSRDIWLVLSSYTSNKFSRTCNNMHIESIWLKRGGRLTDPICKTPFFRPLEERNLSSNYLS